MLQVVDLLVDLIGIEPMTSSMPWKRAPSCATGPLLGRTLLFSLTSAVSSIVENLPGTYPPPPVSKHVE